MKSFAFALLAYLIANFVYAKPMKYAVAFWPGEYPIGFEVTQDTQLSGRLTPDLDTIITESCKVSKGTVIHPWAKKTHFKYMSIFNVGTYKLLKELTVQSYSQNNDPIKLILTPGTEVQELSYLSEGYCLYQSGQMIFEMSCLGNITEDEGVLYEVLQISDLDSQWSQITCNPESGDKPKKVWFEVSELEALVEGDLLQYAEIIGYGEVQE